MTSAPTPPASAPRLAALDATGLLDSPADPAFDRFTRLAAALLRAPVALVVLVGEGRQFFKSVHGRGGPWAALRETPLSHSFCRHVVETGRPLEVADAHAHALVRDNPAVGDLGVVAYLGVPLAAADGAVLGSLCVIDHAPRTWGADAAALLGELAAAVMTEIALRAEAARRARAEEALLAGAARYQGLIERLPYVVYENAPEPPYAPRYVSPAVRGWATPPRRTAAPTSGRACSTRTTASACCARPPRRVRPARPSTPSTACARPTAPCAGCTTAARRCSAPTGVPWCGRG
jgi:hypothetical protein